MVPQGKQPPHIALAGDCSQSAYILRPTTRRCSGGDASSGILGAAGNLVGFSGGGGRSGEGTISYELACTIDVPGTVGSLAVSYGPVLEPTTVGIGPGTGSRTGSNPVADCSRPGSGSVADSGLRIGPSNGGLPRGRGKDATGGFLVDLRLSRPGAVQVAQMPRLLFGTNTHAYGGPSSSGSSNSGSGGAGERYEDRPSARLSNEGVNTGGTNRDREDGWAKIFVPNYDGNRIYVFSMGPGR